jgi:hypothetical protein
LFIDLENLMSRLSRALVWAGALSALWTSTARAQFAELAKRVPSSANAVALVNVEKLMTSPVAVKEKWQEKRDTAFASGVSFLPPDSKQAILAMQIDLTMWVPLWEAAILELDHEPAMDKVAEMTGGTADTVNGKEAVDLPEDAYVVKFAKSTAAFMAPANRQAVGRWLRESESRTAPALSPYLMEAYRFANDVGTPVILALDLEDALPLAGLKAQLADAKEFLTQHKLEAEPVAKLLSGIRGITLGVTFGDKPFGKVKVDFRDAVSISPEAAKASLIHVLAKRGAMIEEFEDWKPAVAGKQVTLEGNLEASGMRRLSSLFDRPPSLKAKQPPSSSPAPENKESVARVASQSYFHKVTDLLKDLQHKNKTNSNTTIPQVGVWMSKYAGKIDQLSVLNVDPELVSYGAMVSDSLRAAHNAITSGAARSRIRQVNTPMQYDYYSGGTTYGYTYRDGYYGAGVVPYGTYGTVAVPDQAAYAHERARVRTEERVTSANDARGIVQNIQQATTDMKRKMTQKYMAEF